MEEERRAAVKQAGKVGKSTKQITPLVFFFFFGELVTIPARSDQMERASSAFVFKLV